MKEHPAILLKQETRDLCAEFARKRLPSSSKLYTKRGEAVGDKIRADIYNGALAEWAAYYYLRLQGLEPSEPDMEIYENKRKSYDPDLRTDSKNIHVKSQSAESADRHGLSWSFQREDPLVHSPKSTDYVLFTRVSGHLVDIVAGVKAQGLKTEELYVKPRVALYSATKTVIYWDELQLTRLNLREI